MSDREHKGPAKPNDAPDAAPAAGGGMDPKMKAALYRKVLQRKAQGGVPHDAKGGNAAKGQSSEQQQSSVANEMPDAASAGKSTEQQSSAANEMPDAAPDAANKSSAEQSSAEQQKIETLFNAPDEELAAKSSAEIQELAGVPDNTWNEMEKELGVDAAPGGSAASAERGSSSSSSSSSANP